MRDLVMNAQDLVEVKKSVRKDTAHADQKRVEFHAHTNMSTMDGIVSAGDLVARAGNGACRQLRLLTIVVRNLFPDAHHGRVKNTV